MHSEARLKKEEHALRMRLRNNVFAQYFPELDKLQIHPGQPNDCSCRSLSTASIRKTSRRWSFEEFVKLVTARKITVAPGKAPARALGGFQQIGRMPGS